MAKSIKGIKSELATVQVNEGWKGMVRRCSVVAEKGEGWGNEVHCLLFQILLTS